jgi:anti-sigma regulatory factor (Ser/Thr protein kinase)
MGKADPVRMEESTARAASVELDASELAPRAARRFVTDTLESWQLSRLTDTATLIASELVTNALLHAHSSCRLTMCHEPMCLRMEAEDSGPGGAVRRFGDADALGGRGLVIVDALSTRWGSRRESGRYIVWCELPV